MDYAQRVSISRARVADDVGLRPRAAEVSWCSKSAVISGILVMTEDTAFVEGCYRLAGGVSQVFMFRRSNGIEEVGIKQNLTWRSGVTGLNAILPNGQDGGARSGRQCVN